MYIVAIVSGFAYPASCCHRWESRVLLESRELHPEPCAAPVVSSLVSPSGKAEIVGSLVSSGDP